MFDRYHLAAAGLCSALALAAAAPVQAAPFFDRIASFPVTLNVPEGADTDAATSAEIIAATPDGNTLVYSDSPSKALGLIDITDPRTPKPLGRIDVEGEPTTTVIAGTVAFVGVNTSESFTEPSGALRTVDLASKAVTASCDLGGQPDSVALSDDGQWVAVAIENQRDEDVDDGAMPQAPAGFVVKLPVKDGTLDCAGLQKIDLAGLDGMTAADDPEPEFLDFNARGELVVTMQENNHIAVIGPEGKISAHFSAGSVDLAGIDTEDDGRIVMDQTQQGRLREPDAVKWIDDDHFAAANEGDYEGGSRGFTIWSADGKVVYESGAEFEKAVAALGHYPEGRSDAKGIEPEGLEFTRFGDQPLLFVAAERASVVGVYDVTDPAAPKLLQILPSGVGPEGLVAIPQRDLFVTANETDLGEDGGARAHVMIYQRSEREAPAYPQIVSDTGIAWGALSGLAVDPADPTRLYAVSDSAYNAAPAIYTIDTAQKPARITAKTLVTRAGETAEKLDLEGIAPDGQGGFWLTNEGDAEHDIPHALLRVTADGRITEEHPLPDSQEDAATRFGLEGVAVVDGKLWLAVQREWKGDAEGQVKLLQFDPATDSWGGVAYPLDKAGDGWVGLSEIAVRGDWLYVIERDNQVGEAAKIKQITRVALSGLQPAPLTGPLPVVTKEVVRDLIPDLKANGGYVLDKVEGLAIADEGTAWIATDNDAVDDSSGETLFWSVKLD